MKFTALNLYLPTLMTLGVFSSGLVLSMIAILSYSTFIISAIVSIFVVLQWQLFI